MRIPAKSRLIKQQCQLSNARQTIGVFVGPCPFPIVVHTLKLPRPHALRHFGRSIANHPLNLGHELIQSEWFGHDFHTLLHPVVAGNYTFGIASNK